MESHGSGAQVTVSFFFIDTINYSKTSIARSFITPLPIFKRIHSLGWLPLLHSFQTLSLTHSHSSILSNTPLLVPPPLVSTILQTPSVHEMLSLPCTLPLLSILILIIHSAMPDEVRALAVAPAPAPAPVHVPTSYFIDHDSSSCLPRSIPSELGMLTNLKELSLFTNSLEGIVPVDALHNLTRLQVLRLFQNNLTGKIESLDLSKLPNLERFSVYGNALEGGLPAGLTESEALVIFDVQRNKYLTGSLGNSATPNITGLSKLRVLSVSYNQLSGDIPGWVWKLPRLQALDLSNNRFSGSFPATLTHLFYFKLNQTTLYQTEFYDGHTTLYEDVPVTIKNTVFTLNYVLSTRINFDVSMNDLEGKIPESFGELLGLTGANLSHNRISGTIPAGTFGRLMQLDELDLSYNKLSGGIPQDLTSLGSLSTLNLAHNQLEGPIPTQNNFDTRFTSASFENNPGLYGCPLSSCNTSYSNASSSDVGSRSTGGQRQQRLLIVVWFHEFVSQWGLLVGYPAGLVLGIFLCRPLSLKLK